MTTAPLRFSVITLAVCGVAALLVSCSNQDRDAGRYQRVETADPEVKAGARGHGPEGMRLRDVMRELADRSAFAPTNDLPADPSANRSIAPAEFAELAKRGDALADAAARIPAGADDVKLFADEREAYESQAAALRRHAQDLGAAARSHNVERTQRTYDRIESTCVQCHTQFQAFAGKLEGFRTDGPPPKGGRALNAAKDDPWQ